MSKKVLIHAGTDKTGTTTIQRGLLRAAGEELLTNSEYLFHNNRAPVYHGMFQSLYRDYDELPQFTKFQYQFDRRRFPEKRDSYRKLFLDTFERCDNLIISSETLFRLEQDHIQALTRDLMEYGFDEFRIVVYIREPRSFYLSHLQQVLKGTHRFSPPGRSKYNFRKGIEAWESVHPGRLTVRSFKDVRDSGVELDFFRIVDDFLYETLTVNDRFMRSFNDRANESMSSEAMLLLCTYHELFHRTDHNPFMRENTLLLRLLRQSQQHIEQTPAVLTHEAGDIVRRRHERDCQWLKERYAVDYLDGEPELPQETVCTAGTGEECRLSMLLRNHHDEKLLDLIDFVRRKTSTHVKQVWKEARKRGGRRPRNRARALIETAGDAVSRMILSRRLQRKMDILYERARGKRLC